MAFCLNLIFLHGTCPGFCFLLCQHSLLPLLSRFYSYFFSYFSLPILFSLCFSFFLHLVHGCIVTVLSSLLTFYHAQLVIICSFHFFSQLAICSLFLHCFSQLYAHCSPFLSLSCALSHNYVLAVLAFLHLHCFSYAHCSRFLSLSCALSHNYVLAVFAFLHLHYFSQLYAHCSHFLALFSHNSLSCTLSLNYMLAVLAFLHSFSQLYTILTLTIICNSHFFALCSLFALSCSHAHYLALFLFITILLCSCASLPSLAGFPWHLWVALAFTYMLHLTFYLASLGYAAFHFLLCCA